MAAQARIHPSAVIGEGVELGVDVVIGPHAVILGPAWIEDRVWIGPGVVIGTPPEVASLPQNVGWEGELGGHGVRIGAGTVIRELSTIHQGSHRTTSVGSDCWVLNSTYIAHDGQVGDRVTLSAGTRLGGHVVVGDMANLGMGSIVHQRRVVGAGAMIGMSTPVTRDVPPFTKVYGSPPRVRGLNDYLLTKLGYTPEALEPLRHRLIAGDVSVLADGPAWSAVAPWADLTAAGGLELMGAHK